MADQYLRPNLIPWVGGIMRNGKSLKPASGLYQCDDWVFDYDGTKKRRGGQVHLNAIPFREGQVVTDHFLGPAVDEDIWTKVENAVEFQLLQPSIITGFSNAAAATAGTLTASLLDGNGDERMPILVQTLDTDPAVAATQTTVIRIAFRTKFTTIPDYLLASERGFRISVDPGRPEDGSTAEWSMRLFFTAGGIYTIDEASSEEEVSAVSGGTNPFNVLISADFIDAEWHDWRLDITRAADTAGPVRHYKVAIYQDEELIFGNVPIRNTSTDPSVTPSDVKCELRWLGSTAKGSIDISLDYFDLHTQDERVRSLAPFVIPKELVAPPQKGAFYTGSRIFIDHGDTHFFQCIEEGLETEKIVDFKTFRGKLIYASTGNIITRPKVYSIGDRKATQISQAPPMSFLQVHRRRVWGAGDNNFPSRLYFSEEGNETLWDIGSGGGFIDIEPDDGQRITGISPSFRGELIVYKERGIFRISGSSPVDFALTPLHQGVVGCASHRTIQNVGNDQYFVSKIGIHSLITTEQYGDLERTFLSDAIRDLWNEIVNPEQLEFSWAVDNEPLDRYQVLVPTTAGSSPDGIIMNRILTLHYSVRTQEFPVGLWSVQNITGSSMASFLRPGQVRDRVIVGSNDGFLNLQDQRSPIDFPVYAA